MSGGMRGWPSHPGSGHDGETDLRMQERPQQRNEFGNLPNVVRNPSFHRGSNAKALMHRRAVPLVTIEGFPLLDRNRGGLWRRILMRLRDVIDYLLYDLPITRPKAFGQKYEGSPSGFIEVPSTVGVSVVSQVSAETPRRRASCVCGSAEDDLNAVTGYCPRCHGARTSQTTRGPSQ